MMVGTQPGPEYSVFPRIKKRSKAQTTIHSGAGWPLSTAFRLTSFQYSRAWKRWFSSFSPSLGRFISIRQTPGQIMSMKPPFPVRSSKLATCLRSVP